MIIFAYDMDNTNEIEMFSPEEMQSPFEAISTINYHLTQIDESGELQLSEAIKKILISSEKWDEQGVLLYNLDAIIAVGYRVNSYS